MTSNFFSYEDFADLDRKTPTICGYIDFKPEIKTQEISGIRVAIHNRSVYLYLREAFHSAYKIYRWSMRSDGLGINTSILEHALLHRRKIRFIIGRETNRSYEISPVEVIDFAKIHRSYDTRRGVKLCIIPKAICKVIRENTIHIMEVLKEEDNNG